MPRTVDEAAQRRVLAYLGPLCDRGRWSALRARALLVTAWTGGLRLSELAALDLGDVADLSAGGALRLREHFYLSPHKAKGGEDGAGAAYLGRAARRALSPYLRASVARAYVQLAPSCPLWVTQQRPDGCGHTRASPRTLERVWNDVQSRAGVEPSHTFHALRHTAVSAFYERSKDAELTRQFARHLRLTTTQRYVHLADAHARTLALLEL